MNRWCSPGPRWLVLGLALAANLPAAAGAQAAANETTPTVAQAGTAFPIAAPAATAAASAITPVVPASPPGGAPAGDATPGPGDGAQPDGPRERPLQYAISYRLDTRIGTRTSEPGFQFAGVEAEFVGSYGRKWEFAGQVPFGSQFASRGRRMHYGNLYAIRKWRLGAPTLKLGQFVVPYGNLTSYDVHNRIIQTLFRYSLGVRIDPGIEAEGYMLGDGNTEWQVAATSGDGPYRLDRHGAPLLTGRVSHKFERQGNTVKLGFSAAAGTLPVFSVTAEPVSAAGSPVLGWSNKRRLALDAELEQGVDLFHFEGDLGTDGGRAARGLWLGWTRPLSANDSLETAAETWQQPEFGGRLVGAWLGAEHRLDGARTVRAALRWCRSHEEGRQHSELSLTAQLVRQF
jgi:hypothetical protein